MQTCGEEDRTLNVGFYAFFAQLSYSDSEDPASPKFNTQRGYEGDLLTAVEAMTEPKLSFDREGIAIWDDIWLQSATPKYDIVSGGITILDTRRRDAGGAEVIAFTDGHVQFRQSLLVRPEDAERLAGYSDLTSDVLVGALAATTGEHRLLELVGLVDADGALVAGVRVDTPGGQVTADGSQDYVITASGDSPNLEGRTHLYPPSDSQPQVVYLGDEAGEVELLDALAAGELDALARGEIGNRDAVQTSAGKFVVTALDEEVETGGFTVAVDDTELLACLNERINWLTNNRSIGYGDWLADSTVFQNRAAMWNEGSR